MIRLLDYYQCIQGEGIHAGTPMWLIRLAGCDVGCPWCDTKESWPLDSGHLVDEGNLVRILAEINPAIRWAMVTGGEPLMQDLDTLTTALHQGRFHCLLETSGTYGLTGTWDHICVSPKIQMPGCRPLNPTTLYEASEIKMVVGRERDLELLDQILPKCSPASTISLQPLSGPDGKPVPSAVDLCLQTCLARNWRLSLQTHKWIGAR